MRKGLIIMKKIIIFSFAILISLNWAYAQWSEQTSGITTQLNSVSAVTDTVVWACGNGGRVIKSNNGGTVWLNATGTGIPATLALYNIFGIDSSTALVTGSTTSSFVYRTSNGGATWVQVFTETGGFVDAIWMTTPLNGYMYGDPLTAGTRWSLWKTVNGGINWDSTGMYLPKAGSEAGWNNAMYVSGTNIWIGTSNSRVYHSPAGGTTTTWLTESTTETNTSAILFNTPVTGMAGCLQPLFLNN